MHPFSPMLFLSAFNHCYIAIIRCPPLMAVFLRCSRLPWGLREGWRLRCFFNLNYSQGTKVVTMTNWGSTLFFLKIIANEAAGLALGCRDSHFSLHYYSINIQINISIFKAVYLYQKMFSNTLCAKMDDNISDDLDDSPLHSPWLIFDIYFTSAFLYVEKLPNELIIWPLLLV